MPVKRTIPTKDHDFNVWQAIIARVALENRERWHLDNTWLDNKFIPARNAWDSIWEDYKDPLMRTMVINAIKKIRRSDYEKVLYVLVANLKVNTLVTDEERSLVAIVMPNRKNRRIAVTNSYPVASIDSSTLRRLVVHFRDSETNSRAKPRGVHGAEIRWEVAEENPRTNNLANSSFDTRTPFTLDFYDTPRGKTVWICLRWETNRGEKGPWGEIVSAIIP